jgi:preprotein translocase subunit SecA
MYDADPTLARYFESALKAHALYKRDRDYIVKDGEIVIVDEFTGRQMPGRRWSEGLHQAIEAKEGLRVQRESVTLATITFQNYFRLYTKLAGMTGTAMTEAEELHKIYKLEVVAIPTHRPMVRDDEPDLVFRNENGKFMALIDEIVEMHEAGPPGPGRHGLGREVRAAGRDAQAPRHQARGPQRQVPREGSPDRGPGRAGPAP